MSLLGNIWVKLGLKSDDFNRGIDNAEKKTSRFGEMIKGVAARVLSVAAALKILAGSLRIITEFEAAQSRLASILGTTVDKMGTLTDAAIDLGRRTQYTASQVTDLQTELAKLGFAEPEILAMQESVLKFAAAVGTDLPSAAARAGATMRGFGLTAEQTGDMLEVMAVSTSKSALSFGYLDSTLGKLVPVARSFGLDTESTIALLGTLANAGIDASSAGTSLRNIFIRLADGSSELNKTIGKQPKTMGELIEAFQTLRDKHVGLEQAQSLVDKRSASVLLALMDNADACADLYRELGNADGALDEMYATMTHNVKGAVEEVKSAWEGFVLSLRGSSGILYTVLTNVRDLIGELNYALFQGTKESTAASNAYDTLKRTIAETANPVAALDIAYRRMLGTAQARVTELEEKSALGRLLNHESLKEARAQVTGLTTAYNRLKGEMSGEPKVIVTPEEEDAMQELLKALAGEKEVRSGLLNELNAEIEAKTKLRDAAQDTSELRKINNEIKALQLKRKLLLGEFDTGRWKGERLTDDEAARLVGLDDETLAAELDAVLAEQEGFLDKFERQKERAEDIAQGFGDAIRQGVVGAIDELAEAIGSGEWDTASFVKSLVGPLADAAIAAGTLILTTGEGLEAVKAAFESLQGPVAIAAGAALVGLGMALKTGMAAIAAGSKGGGAMGATNPYTYAGGYGVTPAMLQQNTGTMEISVSGVLKGQDIFLASENYNRNKGR